MVDSVEKKADLISAVKSPVGLLALVVLVTEVILGLLAAKAEGNDFTILVIGMLLVLLAVLFIVYKKSQELHSKDVSRDGAKEPSQQIIDYEEGNG